MGKLLLLFFIVSCGAREVNIITGSISKETLIKVPESDFHTSLNHVIEDSLIGSTSSDENLKLEIITLGVALDARAGVGELNIGASTGLDLHFKRIDP